MSNPRSLFGGALLVVGLLVAGGVAAPQLFTEHPAAIESSPPQPQRAEQVPDLSTSPSTPSSRAGTAAPVPEGATSPEGGERRAGDIAQDRAAPGSPAPSSGPTILTGGQIEDPDINRLLAQDLQGQPRPPDDIAERAGQAAITWLEADLSAAGRWTDPRVRAVQVVLDQHAGHRGQLRAVAIWSGTTPSANGEELHRTEVTVDPSGRAVTGLADS